MKRTVTILLAVFALALGVTSCSREYWDEQGARKEAARQEKVSAYWDVVGKLVSAADRTEEYASKTFEPVIGTVDPADFIGKYGKTSTSKGNMFNEPVLFLRVMYVDDPGGKMPNLVSQDGRKLRVVHMQGNEEIYLGNKQGLWSMTYSLAASEMFTLDNAPFKAPGIPGLQF